MLKRLNCLKPKKYIKETNYATLMLSDSPEHAKRRVLAMYRILLKDITWIKDVYQITTSERKMRDRIKREFLLHKNVKDLKIIDNLIFTTVEQIEDTKMRHNQRAHVLRWFSEEGNEAVNGFLGKFYDDSMNLPEDLNFGPKISSE